MGRIFGERGWQGNYTKWGGLHKTGRTFGEMGWIRIGVGGRC